MPQTPLYVRFGANRTFEPTSLNDIDRIEILQRTSLLPYRDAILIE
jgi:hypothetical protein